MLSIFGANRNNAKVQLKLNYKKIPRINANIAVFASVHIEIAIIILRRAFFHFMKDALCLFMHISHINPAENYLQLTTSKLSMVNSDQNRSYFGWLGQKCIWLMN